MAQYTGAWRRAVVDQPKVRLKPDADPEHAVTGGTNPGQFHWQADTLIPSIPDEWLGGQYVQAPTTTDVVDGTPAEHGYGMGVGSGLDTYAAQDERTGWHGDDLGAVEARRYQPAPTREGSYTVRVLDDDPGNGHSPGFPAMRYERGVGVGSDPGARTGRRIVRWRDRIIDMHRWDPEGRASVARYAYAEPNASAQSNGNQYTSPEQVYPTRTAGLQSPDQFVVPVTRRSPRPWDESMTRDGVDPAVSYGLTSWGL